MEKQNALQNGLLLAALDVARTLDKKPRAVLDGKTKKYVCLVHGQCTLAYVAKNPKGGYSIAPLVINPFPHTEKRVDREYDVSTKEYLIHELVCLGNEFNNMGYNCQIPLDDSYKFKCHQAGQKAKSPKPTRSR